MAISKIDIYNRALFEVGHTRKVDSPTENTIERRHCDAIYDMHRRAILEMGKWSFAKTFIKLSLTGNTAPDGRAEYHYPIECLKALEIARADSRMPKIPYMTGSVYDKVTGQERRVIWTNEADATLVCIRDAQMPALFTSGFVETLAMRMSVNLANVLAKSNTMSADKFRLFQWAFAQAVLSGEVEAEDEPERDAIWIEQAYGSETNLPGKIIR